MSNRSITAQTRENGMQAILPFVDNTKENVKECLNANPDGMTAREVHANVGGNLNDVRSRLTELTEDSTLVVVGKRKCTVGTTGVTVAVWAIAPSH